MKSTSQRLFLLAGCLAGMIAQGDSIVTTHVVPAAETQTVAPAPAYTYYRFALRQQVGKSNLKEASGAEYFQLAELALYDAAGNRINKNLTKSDASSVAGMAAGTFYIHNGVRATWDATLVNSAYKLFDDDKTTKIEGWVSHLAQDYPDYWALLDMRLASGSPAAVSYNLQSANDTHWQSQTNRCPSAWAILGSNNGTDWDVLDMIDEAEGMTIRTYAQYAWFNGGKPIPFRQNAKMQLLVQSNGKAVVSEDTALDTVLTYGGKTEFSSGTRSTFDIPEGDSMYFGGNVLGSGTIAKSGAGALSVGGLNGAFTGALAVNAGTMAVTRAQVTESAKFYRLALKQFGSSSWTQIGELALYDSAGNRLNLNLQAATGAVSAMPEGTVLVTSTGSLKDKVWTNLFDGDPKTKLEGSDGGSTVSDPSKWTYVYMRLPSGSAPVAGYNLATANDTDNYHVRNPVAWRLESSDDALNWKILDDRDFDYARITYANATWFNGGKMFPVHAESSRPMVYQSNRKYFRFTVTKRVNENTVDGMEFSEFALYDIHGNRVNLNLENKGNSQPIADLTPGSFTAVCSGGVGTHDPDGNESPTKLFDGNTATKAYFWGVHLETGSKVDLVMRLADSAAPVAGYCLAAGTDIQASDWVKSRNPVSWTLEDSVDGSNWRLIAREDDSPLISRTNKLWANGGLPIAITSGDTYDLPEQATLSVATGATLTLPAVFGEGYTKLAVDCIDAGTICNFKSATGMSLYLTNLKQCVKDANRRRTLPISFTGVTDLSTLATWKVYVDGVQKPYYTLGIDGSHLTVSGDPGLIIVVE